MAKCLIIGCWWRNDPLEKALRIHLKVTRLVEPKRSEAGAGLGVTVVTSIIRAICYMRQQHLGYVVAQGGYCSNLNRFSPREAEDRKKSKLVTYLPFETPSDGNNLQQQQQQSQSRRNPAPCEVWPKSQ